MKQITIANGEIRNGYTLADLSESAKEKAIQDHRNFLITTDDDYREDEYFIEDDYSDESVIESLEINGYLFDVTGEMLWITTHVGRDNKPYKHTFNYTAKLAYDCTITDM